MYASNNVFLMKQPKNLWILEGESTTSHLNEFNMIVNELGLVIIKIEEMIKTILFLCSLPKSYENLVMIIHNTICGEEGVHLWFQSPYLTHYGLTLYII